MKSELKLFARLLNYMKKYRAKMILAIVFVIGGSMLSALLPMLLGRTIDYITSNVVLNDAGFAQESTIDFGQVSIQLLYIGVFVLSAQGAIYISNRLAATAIQNTMKDIRSEITHKLNRLPISFFDGHQQGDILSRITNDVENISNSLQQGLFPIITAVLTIIFVAGMLLTISLKVAAITLLIVPCGLFISKKIVEISQIHFDTLQKSLGALNGFIQEDYSGFNIVKLYGQEEVSKKEFARINRAIRDTGRTGNFLSALIMPLSGMVTNLVYVTIAVMCGYDTLNGLMSIGTLQASTQYVWQINNPVSQITQLVPIIQGCFAAIHRVFNILDQEEEATEVETIQLPEKIQGNVEFQHVDFGYLPNKLQIKDLSISAKSGQTIAIVGPTGAGKTTLVNLLLRFYEINNGTITIDGMNIQELTREQLRSVFGMVLQDAWLYQTTLADNIRFGKLDATDEEVINAAKVANVHHFIEQLPDGYNTILNEETSNVSQGQKQLITIARAVLSDPAIMILDEATSSVDTRLEVLIQAAMAKVMENRTSFVIAHRLSTIKEADLILVLRDGEIIEQGTHNELLAQGGFYEELYNSQFSEDE